MTYIVSGLLLALLSLWLLIRSWQPPGHRQRYRGTNAKYLHGTLVSWEYGVVGKPDFIIDHNRLPVPILIKQGKAPGSSAHDSHIAQILIYCLLVHENAKVAPPYGIIRYRDRTFEVDYNERSVEAVLDLVDEIHLQRGKLPPRSHEKERHCFACQYRRRCDVSLYP